MSQSNETIEDVRFAWIDFEPEPETTGDGSGDPSVHYLTIYENGEEMATITHRFGLLGERMDASEVERKQKNAERIVEALRAHHGER